MTTYKTYQFKKTIAALVSLSFIKIDLLVCTEKATSLNPIFLYQKL